MDTGGLQDSSFSQQFKSQESFAPKSKNPKKLIFFVIVLLIIGGGIYGGKKYIGGIKNTLFPIHATPIPSPSPSPSLAPLETPIETPIPSFENTPTPIPTSKPTPKPTQNPIDSATGLDRSDLSVEVQNGSGAVGAASKASDILTVLGYHVVSIGNANNFDYESTTILVSDSKSKFLDLLKKDLSSSYTIGSSSATLSATSSANAVVIVGKE